MQAETPFALSVSYHEELFDTLRANGNVVVGHAYMNYWELANFMDKIPSYRIGKILYKKHSSQDLFGYLYFRNYEQNLSDIPCEPGKIQQEFLNILCNGAEAMQEGTGKADEKTPHFVLRPAYEQEAGRVRIEIEDSGPGMDEATHKRVFEPFFITKPVGRGTGLGLSVSYFIVIENHGGEISVESLHGEGTTFIISLPIERRQS